MRLDICIPAHNEARILRQNCLKLLTFCREAKLNFDWQIVIIVNGSSDDSLAIAERLAEENTEIKTIMYEQGGKGNAIVSYWNESVADVLVFMDADLATKLSCLPSLLEPFLNTPEHTLVLGSRHISGAEVRRSWRRSIASWVYSGISRLYLGHSLSDLQCGFKAISKDLFKKILPQILDRGWFFDTELVVWSLRTGATVKEIPVQWRENRSDHPSKISLLRDSRTFLRSLAALRKRLREQALTINN